MSTIDVPSVSLLLSYVSGGLGMGLVPALALAEGGSGRRAYDWERAAVPALTVTLVHRPGFRRSTAAERFATRLAAEGRRAGARLRRLGLG